VIYGLSIPPGQVPPPEWDPVHRPGDVGHAVVALADSHGIWLGSPGSLWLYASGSLFKVADLPVGAVGGQSPARIESASAADSLPPPVVAGPCS
jgi:hypothetical protein